MRNTELNYPGIEPPCPPFPCWCINYSRSGNEITRTYWFFDSAGEKDAIIDTFFIKG